MQIKVKLENKRKQTRLLTDFYGGSSEAKRKDCDGGVGNHKVNLSRKVKGGKASKLHDNELC
jgi:hypothetical protein